MKVKLNANAQAVLDVVRAANNHPTASEIFELVKLERPHIGLASVYRILHGLVEQHAITELRHSDDSCRYDGHVSRHDHAICTECGALLDVPLDIPLSQELLEAIAKTAGIELSFHELRLYGRCLACSSRSRNHNLTIQTALRMPQTVE